MGATTTTGTAPINNGAGGAWANKGPGNSRNVFVPLVTPNIVCAGSITTAAGTGIGTIVFPTALDGAPTAYAVILTTVDAAAASKGASVTTKSGSTTFTGFAILSEGASQVVQWAVIKVGAA